MLSIIALLLVAPAAAQSSGGAAYAVGGIAVDVAAANPPAARQAAWRLAQRRAWPILWSRLTGRPATAAPRLNDAQLDSIVAGIESQGENVSATRYIATLGVVFDRSRTADWLAGAGGLIQSPPMLLLPVMVDGGAASVYNARTPWRAAWSRYAGNVTPIDYVLAEGSAADNLWLTGWQPARPDRGIWRDILTRYDTADVLIAEARLTRAWPGGPVSALIIVRHGPDATEIGRFRVAARGEEGLDAMFNDAVARADALFSYALRTGRLQSEPDLALELTLAGAGDFAAPIMATQGSDSGEAALEVAVATPDAATATAAEALLRTTPGVIAVTGSSLSIGGTTRLMVYHRGTTAELAYALDRRGWRLADEAGVMLLRRRREAEAPLPAPVAPPPSAPAPVSARPAPAPVSARPAPAPAAPRPAPESGPLDLLPER